MINQQFVPHQLIILFEEISLPYNDISYVHELESDDILIQLS